MIIVKEDSELDFHEYLESILSDEDIEALEFCKQRNCPVIITGSKRTGKSTLERVLRSHGYSNVYEYDSLPKIVLNTQISEDKCTANAHRYIR